MSDELTNSIAWSVLTPQVRRMFSFVRAQIEKAGTSEPIPITNRLFVEAGFSNGQVVAAGTRQLTALGLIERKVGFKRGTIFSLSDRWREITDQHQAMVLAAQAREPLERNHRSKIVGRKNPKPVRREKVTKVTRTADRIEVPPDKTAPRPITLPSLEWLREFDRREA